MKSFLSVFLVIGMLLRCDAQFRKPADPLRMKASFFSFHGVVTDFQTLLNNSAKGTTSGYDAGAVKNSFGFSAGWWKGLGTHSDFNARYTGTFASYPANFIKNDSIGATSFSHELSGSLVYRFLDDRSVLNPFISAGIGAGFYQPGAGIFAPVSAGLQIRTPNGFYLFAQAQANCKLTGRMSAGYLQYSLGFSQGISLKKNPVVVIASELPMVKDADRDGTPDEKDACPYIAGPANLQGCPDSDADGFTDPADACPDQFGYSRYMGCPVPDMDGDGIDDEQDHCPNQAGVSAYLGCPVPDGDGDSVPDDVDQCPSVAGEPSLQGCPRVAEQIRQRSAIAARNIGFHPNSHILLPSAVQALEEVVSIMQTDKDLRLKIEGHTDNTGHDNQRLSEMRAEAVKNFLLSKNIEPSRLNAIGMGDKSPLASNETAGGRARNRRVELIFSY